MPVFSDPSLLTAARLKEELTKYNVPFKPNRAKKYYVELYEQNVREDDSSSKIDFSSDDEVAPARRPVAVVRSQKRASTESTSAVSPQRRRTGQDDIASLSDADLRSELKSYGFDVGPISDSTRTVCQRKLRDFRRKSPAKSPSRQSGNRGILFSDEEADNGDDYYDDDEDEDVEEQDEESDVGAEDEEVDHAPMPTARTWSKVTQQQLTAPTVAQAGSTPPRSTSQRPALREQWPVRLRSTPSTTTSSSTKKTSTATKLSTDQVNVTDYDTVDRRGVLLQRQGATRMANFLVLIALFLAGFLLVIVLACIEGPHRQLIPAMPDFSKNMKS